MRAQPPPTALQAQRAEGTGGRAAHKTAHNKAEDMKALCCLQSPVQLPHGCYRRTLAACPGLSCSFCKMGAQCVPSGLAMRSMAEVVQGGCWDRDWPEAGAHEQ